MGRDGFAKIRQTAAGLSRLVAESPSAARKEADVAQCDKGTDCGTALGPHVTLPVIGLRLALPKPERLAWYAGLGLMAAFELVDWELALIIGVGHLIADNVHNQTIAELASGAQSGA
jgi:hypothetical protein